MARNYIKEKELHFGLDYIVLYAFFRHEEMFKSLNYENSDYGELEDYVFTKQRIPKYLYGINFNYKNYKVFSYVKGDPSLAIPTKNAITVYGVAFKLLTLKEIDYFLQGYFFIDKLKRFDICIDINDNIKNVLRKFKKLKQSGGDIYGKKGEVETHYIGNPKRSENRRSVIRIYNKHQDLKNSRKEKLYLDYFEFPNVTRIEIEIRRELAKNFNYHDLFVEENLKSLFKNYFRKHTHIFDYISETKLTLYRKPKKFSDDDMQSIYYKNLFKSSLIGYMRRVYQQGADPVRIAISKGFIQESTIGILGRKRVNKIRRKEEEIRRKILYLKNERYEQRD